MSGRSGQITDIAKRLTLLAASRPRDQSADVMLEAAVEIERQRKLIAVTRAQHDHAHWMLMRRIGCPLDDAQSEYREKHMAAYREIDLWRKAGVVMPPAEDLPRAPR